ncbi:MAG: Sfum_1244 family protein [Acidiferrobacterales bacterium]
MWNLGSLATAVQHNCHISDARHAGDYTVCVFLLKMREFYRWENQIPFTGALLRDDVGTWLAEREHMWDEIESSPFSPIPLETGLTDPFDSDAINRELTPRGYIYSAGFGRFNKPHFFLGALERTELRDGFTIHTAACEYARDMVAPPAMLQENTIFVRQESVRRFLWEKVEEWRWNRKNETMGQALAAYRFDDDTDAALERMTQVETESMILHELGEGMAGALLGDRWNAMLLDLSRSKGEIMARAVRDLLADCLSTLPGLLECDNPAPLHFHFATFGGMRRHLYPEALEAYRHWAREGDASVLRRAADAGRERWLATAQTMLDLHRQYGTSVGAHIERFLEPEAA